MKTQKKITLSEYLIGWTIDLFLRKTTSEKIGKLATVQSAKNMKLNQFKKAQAHW